MILSSSIMLKTANAFVPYDGREACASLPPGRDYDKFREMYNGRIICRRHGFSTCEACDVDYGWLDDVLPADNCEENELVVSRTGVSLDEEFSNFDRNEDFASSLIGDLDHPDDPFAESGLDRMSEAGRDSRQAGARSHPQTAVLETRSGTGRVFPTVFRSSEAEPLELVKPECRSARSGESRYIHRDDDSTALLLVSGSCEYNGKTHARGGWGVVFGPGNNTASGPVEPCNPFTGRFIKPTSNRAKLRAVIAGVRSHGWAAEGFKNLIIVTDSSYVVDVATIHARNWIQRTEFKANEDLWRLLLGEVERQDEMGVAIQLWRCSGGPSTYDLVDKIASEASKRSSNPSRWAAGEGM
ncbi:unnamed protein product [Clonostachys solani]|uniref:RNase H type-1 domain-containing protein n=1 Tax=Clonostachys solani TaxID=160281 RepID=A0A9N9ZP14_9HYPO|nr:unnamed protein product [Clonostachys solani]